jgi:hypothetical protein
VEVGKLLFPDAQAIDVELRLVVAEALDEMLGERG